MFLTNLEPKKYKRFFAFGCSFTNYIWPTWADIIACDIPYYENWAQMGSGNHFIFNSVIECDARNKFTEHDLIIIMWSRLTRNDHYQNDKWVHVSETNQKEIYGKEYVKKFPLEDRAGLVRDLAYMKAVQAMLSARSLEWSQTSICPLANLDLKKSGLINLFTWTTNTKAGFYKWLECNADLRIGKVSDYLENRDILETYIDVFKHLEESVTSTGYILEPRPQNNNYHPSPLEALDFIDKVWPSNCLSDRAREYAKYWETEIRNPKYTGKSLITRPLIERL